MIECWSHQPAGQLYSRTDMDVVNDSVSRVASVRRYLSMWTLAGLAGVVLCNRIEISWCRAAQHWLSS